MVSGTAGTLDNLYSMYSSDSIFHTSLYSKLKNTPKLVLKLCQTAPKNIKYIYISRYLINSHVTQIINVSYQPQITTHSQSQFTRVWVASVESGLFLTFSMCSLRFWVQIKSRREPLCLRTNVTQPTSVRGKSVTKGKIQCNY